MDIDLKGMRQTMTKQADSPHDYALLPASDLLMVLARQIEASIVDNNQAMSSLIDAHTKIASTLGQSSVEDRAIRQELSRMVVAFQEHDALNQRLEHVVDALQESCGLLSNRSAGSDPNNWRELEARISSHYTTLQERQVHDGKQPTSPVVANNDIELF